jgi:hypothetical protein
METTTRGEEASQSGANTERVACAESMTMNLTTPDAMAPANTMDACLRLNPASKG